MASERQMAGSPARLMFGPQKGASARAAALRNLARGMLGDRGNTARARHEGFGRPASTGDHRVCDTPSPSGR